MAKAYSVLLIFLGVVLYFCFSSSHRENALPSTPKQLKIHGLHTMYCGVSTSIAEICFNNKCRRADIVLHRDSQAEGYKQTASTIDVFPDCSIKFQSAEVSGGEYYVLIPDSTPTKYGYSEVELEDDTIMPGVQRRLLRIILRTGKNDSGIRNEAFSYIRSKRCNSNNDSSRCRGFPNGLIQEINRLRY